MPPRSRWSRNAPRPVAHISEKGMRSRGLAKLLGRTPAWGVPGTPQRCNAIWSARQHRCPKLQGPNGVAWRTRLPSWEDGMMPAGEGLLCRKPYRHYEEARTSHVHWLCGTTLPDPIG